MLSETTAECRTWYCRPKGASLYFMIELSWFRFISHIKKNYKIGSVTNILLYDEIARFLAMFYNVVQSGFDVYPTSTARRCRFDYPKVHVSIDVHFRPVLLYSFDACLATFENVLYIIYNISYITLHNPSLALACIGPTVSMYRTLSIKNR